jgi:hypothetical protein
MSNRGSLPSTPLHGTPTLGVPSPARTPSPRPLFSPGGGPYSYSGQITRKYDTRFKHINKTREAVKDVRGAWEQEAKTQGMGMDELIKSQESEHSGHELPDPKTPRNPERTPSMQLDGVTEVARSSEEMGAENRRSVDSDQFVDALTSPLHKPKDWGERHGDK